MMDLHKKAIPLTRGSLFDCRSSTKTAHEKSTTCAVEWLQSTVKLGFGMCVLCQECSRSKRCDI